MNEFVLRGVLHIISSVPYEYLLAEGIIFLIELMGAIFVIWKLKEPYDLGD